MIISEDKKKQIENLKKICKDYGVADDLIDFNHLVDDKLNYEENKTIMTDVIKGLANMEKVNEVEGTKKAIRNEKQVADKVEKEQLEREEENTKKELDTSINNIKFKSSNELDKAFKIIKQLTSTLIKSKDINGLILKII